MVEPGQTVRSTAPARPWPSDVRFPTLRTAGSRCPNTKASTGVLSPVGSKSSAHPKDSRPVEAAVEALADGRPVLVTTDGGEVAIMAAASLANVELLAFMVRHTSGFICVALPEADCARLVLPPMQARSARGAQADFRVTVDAAHGIGTGISARDRARTVVLLADAESGAADFTRPGHVVPVAAREGGVLEHPGDAEAGIDLAMLAGLAPAAVMARMVSPSAPERMATPEETVNFGADRRMPTVQVNQLRAYRRFRQKLVTRMASTRLPMGTGTAQAIGYRGVDGSEYLTLVVGSVAGRHMVPTYIHHECLLGDVFGSVQCACGHRLDMARRAIGNSRGAVLIYVRGLGGREPDDPVDHLCSTDAAAPKPYAEAVSEQILRDLGVLSSVPYEAAFSAEAYRPPACVQPASASYLTGGF
jgi:3,4-dihydroxy 2-butanone 4-phosphate synthase/GTP cyclohydrolase II